MNKFIINIYFLILIKPISAQDDYNIFGKVVDAVSKQPLIGVNILVIGTTNGSATNENGTYKITGLTAGNYSLRASLVGYETFVKTDINISSSHPQQVDFELKEQAVQLENVTVTSNYFNSVPTEVNSVRSFSYEEIRKAPGGFEDVVRALSVLPGVAQADAGRNDLIVRGGAPSENLYTVDGVEIPNINHFGTQGAAGGPLSYINLDFVKGTTFSTGGFSAAYGDKLSSVLNISLREGRNDRFGGKATIAATQFGLNLEGPLSNGSSFLFSVRRSYLDFIFKAAGFGFVPEYYDVLSKVNFKIDNNNSISFIFVSAFDYVNFFNDTEKQRFDNARILGSNQTQYVAGLNYQHLFKNGFYNLILSRNYTDYNTSQKDLYSQPIFLNKSREGENALKWDLVYKLSSSAEINIGASIKNITYNSDILFPTFITTFGDSLPTTKLADEGRYTKGAAYATFSNTLFDRLTTNIGARLDYFDAINNKLNIGPRISTSYKLNELTDINGSFGIYYQAPSYIWLLADQSNKNLNSVRVAQYIAGFNHRLREDLLFKTEIFYKQYSNYPASLVRQYLVLANTGAGFAGSDDNFSAFGLEPLSSAGKGNSRGVELSIQKKLSDVPIYGIASFTYSKSQFAALDGVERPGSYDQNWIINLSGGYKFNHLWEASIKFRYASGKPYTPFNLGGTQSVINYNTLRFEAAHSLDVRVERRWLFETLSLITYIDIQNIYNNKSATSVRWDARSNSVEENKPIGLLPSIGVSLEF
ncbi:MAG: TonB-dependent receptor [Ignavibacteriaceae bacterium]|nr:TonB-dependent receptor [Ignavibacteriaceae bacterium]